MNLTIPSGLAVIGLSTSVPGGREHFARTLASLDGHPAFEVVAVSDTMSTAPVGGEVFAQFGNAACVVRTALAPHTVLRALQHLERLCGRIRDKKNGPRTLDLDLLLVGNVRLRSADLDLPHLRLLERDFAAVPAAQALHRAGVELPPPLLPFLGKCHRPGLLLSPTRPAETPNTDPAHRIGQMTDNEPGGRKHERDYGVPPTVRPRTRSA